MVLVHPHGGQYFLLPALVLETYPPTRAAACPEKIVDGVGQYFLLPALFLETYRPTRAAACHGKIVDGFGTSTWWSILSFASTVFGDLPSHPCYCMSSKDFQGLCWFMFWMASTTWYKKTEDTCVWTVWRDVKLLLAGGHSISLGLCPTKLPVIWNTGSD